MMVAIYTTDMKSWLVSGTIRFAEQWNRSHVLLAFTEDYAEGRQFTGDYFESINKKDGVTGKTGVRGPIDLKVHLWDWIDEDPKNRPQYITLGLENIKEISILNGNPAEDKPQEAVEMDAACDKFAAVLF